MAAALITQIFRTASTLTKFGSIIDHFILMQTDMSIIFLSAFLAEIHAFYVYRGAGSQIRLTTTRSTESACMSQPKNEGTLTIKLSTSIRRAWSTILPNMGTVRNGLTILEIWIIKAMEAGRHGQKRNETRFW